MKVPEAVWKHNKKREQEAAAKPNKLLQYSYQRKHCGLKTLTSMPFARNRVQTVDLSKGDPLIFQQSCHAGSIPSPPSVGASDAFSAL